MQLVEAPKQCCQASSALARRLTPQPVNLFHVAHEKDSKSDHQEWPRLEECGFPARGQLRQSSNQANTAASDRKVEMLRLNARHHRHVIGAAHPAVMVVKKQQNGPKQGENGERPAGPCRFQNAAHALCLKDAKSQQDRGKGLVLQIFRVVAEAVPPALGSKGPELRVAEHEQEQAGKNKAGRPGKTDLRPALAQCTLPKKEKTRKDDQKTSQVVIELAFLFVLGGCLLSGATLGLVGHGHVYVHIHIHAFVSALGWTCSVRLRCPLCNGQCE